MTPPQRGRPGRDEDGILFVLNLDNTLAPTDWIYYQCGRHMAGLIAGAVARRNGGLAPDMFAFNGRGGLLWAEAGRLRERFGACRDYWPLGAAAAYEAWCGHAGLEP